MKKSILFGLLLMFTLTKAQQQNVDLSKWYVFKVYTSGVNDVKTADYIERTLEKTQLALFSAFNPADGSGYVILKDAYLINEIEKYINNMLYGVKVEQYESAELNEDLFLNIYFLRGRVPLEKRSVQLPTFIQIGPYLQYSNDLYATAKSAWIKKYPDAYKALTPEPKPLTPEEQAEKEQKLNRKN